MVGLAPATRIAVDVTFLEMLVPPATPAPALPEGWAVVRAEAPDVALYRRLYDGVGADYCWWLRRTMPDADLALLLQTDGISIHLLVHEGEIAGFFELDARIPGSVNLAYFGLMPSAVGHRLGRPFLARALAEAWAYNPFVVRVNTCTADHPRALGTYVAAGFCPTRVVREVWDIPHELGMRIPDHLRI